jgi:hypothetical protein
MRTVETLGGGEAQRREAPEWPQNKGMRLPRLFLEQARDDLRLQPLIQTEYRKY